MNQNALVAQPYLLTRQLTTPQRQLLFSLRCKTYDVKSHYKQKFAKNMTCRTCKEENSFENVQHLLLCHTLKVNSNSCDISVEDIYGNLTSQVKFVKIFEMIHNKRKLIIELEDWINHLQVWMALRTKMFKFCVAAKYSMFMLMNILYRNKLIN